MSYNPVRAANFRKTGRKRRPLDPHAGVKHSDIMKRQGLGTTVPMAARTPTPHGFAAEIFACSDFTLRSEVIGAGNSTGYGVNPDGDRVYHVVRGVLFVFVEGKEVNGEPQRDILQVQAGAFFKAERDMKHGVAASGTNDVEVLVVESADFAKTWEVLEAGETRDISGVLAGGTPQEPSPVGTARRTDQSQAKAQAANMAVQATRRRPRGPAQAAAGPGQPARGGALNNANSATVEGVNPRPVIPSGD